MLETPVLFLIFNRPDLTEIVFEEIRKIQPKQLYVAADGPRADKDGEEEKCIETRKIIEKIDWDCEVKTLFRDKNIGLRKAVTEALDWFFDNEEMGIILEDDCVADSSFFTFCEEMLEYYRHDTRIMHIAGSNFQKGLWWGDGSYYFSKISAQCWGWATWRRAWKLNNPSMEGFDNFIKERIIFNLFDDEDFNNFWLKYYKDAYEKKISSWNAVWSYSIVTQNGLCVIPNKNLVANIGYREDSVHCKDSSNPDANISTSKIEKISHPSSIIPNKEADYYIIRNRLNLQKKNSVKPQIKYCIKPKSILYPESCINNIRGDISAISIGENTHIRGHLQIFAHGGHIKIGDYCYVGENTKIWSACKIEIGNYVLISHDVNIFDSTTHPIDPLERREHFKTIVTKGFPKQIDSLNERPVIIHDDVWICAKSIILAGVKIGEGSIVGAGSVVTKDVEPYTIVAGNPAKFIRKIEPK